MNTPLHIACYTKALSIIRLFLDRKCITSIPNKKDETAEEIPLNEDGDCILHIACQWGDADIVKYLITDQRCNPYIANTSKHTPLHTASKHGHLDVVKVLINRKVCDFNTPDKEGNTPLHTACKHGHHSTVEFLVSDHRCQLHAKNGEGETPLHTASQHLRQDVVKVLVGRKDCDLNVTDQRGNTPLHKACYIKALSIIKLLLEKGCSTNIPNMSGRTVQEIPLNEHGDYLLHIACQWGDVDMVKDIVTDQTCDPNIQNKYRLTPTAVPSMCHKALVGRVILLSHSSLARNLKLNCC